ncbi:hypothetical protein NPIL_404601 [Nephila pilipes]|uniref:Uncharacterized protein n=1 Tax=Nephila pilipes TaxID=299642 RepID=A0A8X6R0E0_NEPPI|nr:hypothetical protein NPIL_404601 [Nephila pilipes]
MKSDGHRTNPDSQNIRAHTSNTTKSGKAFIRKLAKGFAKTGYSKKGGKENIRCKREADHTSSCGDDSYG